MKLENVDLGIVDALLLRPPQLSGRLNGSGTVAGTKNAPSVKAEFQVAPGGFGQFKYDSLTGTGEYSGQGVIVDARLQRTSSEWLAAKGYVPRAAFNADLRAATEHREATRAEDRIDLHIDSSSIDLGFV